MSSTVRRELLPPAASSPLNNPPLSTQNQRVLEENEHLLRATAAVTYQSEKTLEQLQSQLQQQEAQQRELDRRIRQTEESNTFLIKSLAIGLVAGAAIWAGIALFRRYL